MIDLPGGIPMEYTIKAIAQLSGVSARTLRYYDELKLLKPKRINSSGYRIYGEAEVDRLQQILFYRSLDMKLEEIKKILDQPNFQITTALEGHYRQLLKKRASIDSLISTVEKTLRYQKGESPMTDSEKFEAFKAQKVQENEATYGQELREQYGEDTMKQSNKKFSNLTEEQYQKMNETEKNLISLLRSSLSADADVSEVKRKLVDLHKEWLSYTWPSYSVEAHKGLAEMYLVDERFTAYYDEKAGKGATKLLAEAIKESD